MSTDVSKDQLVLIRIDGMHCHRCEEKISRALSSLPGVHEVEVDFNASLASVLFDETQAKVHQLTSAVTDVGYTVSGFSVRHEGRTE